MEKPEFKSSSASVGNSKQCANGDEKEEGVHGQISGNLMKRKGGRFFCLFCLLVFGMA